MPPVISAATRSGSTHLRTAGDVGWESRPTGRVTVPGTLVSMCCMTSSDVSVFKHCRWCSQSDRPHSPRRHAGSHGRPLVIGRKCGEGMPSRCGLVMPKIPSVGTPNATPKCIIPESFDTRTAHWRRSAAVSVRFSLPTKFCAC